MSFSGVRRAYEIIIPSTEISFIPEKWLVPPFFKKFLNVFKDFIINVLFDSIYVFMDFVYPYIFKRRFKFSWQKRVSVTYELKRLIFAFNFLVLFIVKSICLH